MNIVLLSVFDGIDNIGVRKVGAYLRRLTPNVDIYFLVPGNFRGLLSTLLMIGESDMEDSEINEAVDSLVHADIIGFSSMSGYAHIVKKIIDAIKKKHSKRPYLIWGGIHPIVNPEDAILSVDAICTGEGEFAFEMFFSKYTSGQDFFDTPSFWFNTPQGVQKNNNLPLMTSQIMSELPLMIYQDREKIYKKGKGFVELIEKDFVAHNSVAYHTIFTIGCPLKCNFCSNSAFIKYDLNYRKIRHPSVSYIVKEIKTAINKHPFISVIVFNDDGFMALKADTLREFSLLYKKEIGIPFVVAGVIPTYVREEKMKILVDAGMKRVRMGIQSGSERILNFYRRSTPIRSIRSAAQILNQFKDKMVPPAFDLILDNPVEKLEDTLATLDLIYELPRPFTLNFFSLRILPNTQLSKDVETAGVDIEQLKSGNYRKTLPTLGNCLLYLLVVYKPSNRIYTFFRGRVKPSHENQPIYPVSMIFLRLLYLAKRAFYHLRHLEFSNLPGFVAYYWWRLRNLF